MVYKPLETKLFLRYVKLLGWSLKKGGMDWNLFDDKSNFICSIKIAHGKHTKEEVVANSVHKVEKICKEKGLSWPPRKK